MRINFSYVVVFVALFFATTVAEAQSDTLQNRIIIDQADSSVVENINTVITQYLYGNVSVYQDSMFLFCDRATLNSNVLTAAGNVGIVQADTINVYADSLIYYGNRKIAEFFDNVTLDHGEQKLYTDYLLYDIKTKTAVYRDTALMTNGTTLIQSLNGSYQVNKKLASFRDQVVVIDSSFNLRSDSLDYLLDKKRVIFLCPTAITLDTADIYCEGGYYDMDDGFAMFTGNPQYQKEDTKAIADTIYYDESNATIRMEGNAIYLDEDKEAIADQIVFKEKTEEAILIGNASYRDSSYQVTGENIFRSGTTGKLKVTGRSFISNPPMIIKGDSLDYNETDGQGLAIGSVEWKDTAAHVTIYCDRADYNDQKETIKAIGYNRRPLMENVIDEDTLYLAADTLFSYKKILANSHDQVFKDTILVNSTLLQDSLVLTDSLIEHVTVLDSTSLESIKLDSIKLDTLNSFIDSLPQSAVEVDTARIFAAYPDVKIFKSDMQAVCDSLIYNDLDSIFHLYRNPIMWSDSTQFLGDTILILLKNKKIDKVKTRTNSFIITEIEVSTYDQIKGRNTVANFIDGEIDNMEVVGNAEAIYYIKDDEDDSFIGMNNTICSSMRFFFLNKDLDRIDFYDQPTSVMTPIQDVDPLTSRLENFRWLINKRPLSLEDILKTKKSAEINIEPIINTENVPK